MNVLELNNIQKNFGNLRVLRDITVTVAKGEVVAIIGPSGSGKSTLLRCATMLETIDSGEIKYMGEIRCPNRRRRKGYLRRFRDHEA